MDLNSNKEVKDDPEIAAPSSDAREPDAAEPTPAAADANVPATTTEPDEGQAPKSSSGRKRVPTAAALASSEQAQEAAPGKSKTRQRKKAAETSVVSRTSHGGVKIGGRAVTWVGGAGMPREVCHTGACELCYMLLLGLHCSPCLSTHRQCSEHTPICLLVYLPQNVMTIPQGSMQTRCPCMV